MPRITGTLEDREEIRELYARYVNTVDTRQFEEWVECFTSDGVFESPLLGKFSGEAALHRFTGEYETSWQGGGVRHMICNLSFEIDGDQAVGTCGLIYFKVHGGKSEYLLTGGYNDTLRKVNGEWRFASRKVYIDG